ncbi:YbaB/EbfC family nucleoid-associated protein [Rhodococcus sp. ABRD24]|uniref:YbaB/EbfC family nucleoid-associated protein n=1 Tax=Rhodococcus sp. ABRD24 TaxID=2507582 RepID=UPI001F614EB2|nr:YbaB/EbfC family nucleoid-associated protein [Rhodococcus sp. ABRD24]
MTDDQAREQLRQRNAVLREQVGAMLEDVKTQCEALSQAQALVAASTGEALSADGLARVTVDASGVVVCVDLVAETFTRTTPTKLAQSITEAARDASAQVRSKTAEIMAPIAGLGSRIPDLPDLVPGAPSIRNLVPSMATEMPAEPQAALEYDDESAWGAAILREAHRE